MTTAPEDQRRSQSVEEAAFFYRGSSEVVSEGVVFFPSFGTCTAFLCDDRIFVVDTTVGRFAPRLLEDLRANHSQAPVVLLDITRVYIWQIFIMQF